MQIAAIFENAGFFSYHTIVTNLKKKCLMLGGMRQKGVNKWHNGDHFEKNGCHLKMYLPDVPPEGHQHQIN